MANSMREKVGEVLKGFLDSKTAVITKNHQEYVKQAVLTVKKLEDEKRDLQAELSRLKSMSIREFIVYKWRK